MNDREQKHHVRWFEGVSTMAYVLFDADRYDQDGVIGVCRVLRVTKNVALLARIFRLLSHGRRENIITALDKAALT